MKVLVAVVVFVAASVIALPASQELETEWAKFKTTYGKTYKSLIEEKQRKAIFAENYNFITEHNQKYNLGLETFTVGVNKFADTTAAERKILKGYKKSNKQRKFKKSQRLAPADDLPESYDWREQAAVTEIKDQGACGSCWAFSTVGSLETQYFLKTKKLVDISAQNLVDCSTDNWGCDGGDMPLAFDYIHENDGIDSEKSYPYIADDDVCHYDKANNVTSVKDYVVLDEGDEDQLKQAVASVGTVSVAIDASQLSFDFYTSGIYAPKNCMTANEDLDHAVLVVGYGTEDGTDFWWVKNSWSDDWGIEGYIKMIRNDNNHCGIATESVYPILY